ncbi:uncharacterized protein LOC132202063 isoform X2 [Neocloeon triangulifer]|uniref:uncharacterized protein LOC132202063 isoform X2 n=1 Tax=Neocloeon triangulifer TaxID=2078957 RepID=UPI00286F90C0|nr:uncharacterized protein LOC132202063 isoform X2 [Neocloeon triangulifer]
MTSQLVEVACGIALSESRKKKQTLLFRGDTECDVTRNLLTALKNICGKYDSKLDAKLEILHIFHQKADNSEGSDVPYYFKIIRNCDGDEFEFQFKNSSIFEYSHELLLPAALMYGASVELSSKMRISEVNSLKIPIQMKHPSSFYKQFISEVRKAFLELNLGNHMNFIWTVTAAILHIRSGNWTIAEELLGVGKNSLEESLDRIYSDKTTFCNALFHTTAEMIIGDALGRQSRKWEETGEEAVSLIGVVQKYSRGTDWMDFCSNYQSDLLQLMQNMEELSVPIPTNTSGGTKNDTSVINDFTRGTKELKFLVTKKAAAAAQPHTSQGPVPAIRSPFTKNPLYLQWISDYREYAPQWYLSIKL